MGVGTEGSDISTPLLRREHNHDLESFPSQTEMLSDGESKGMSRCMKCSAVLNILLLLLTAFLLAPKFISSDTEDDLTPKHHNHSASQYDCPFASTVPTANLRGSSGNNLAVAQTGVDFVALCWRNVEAESRGEYIAPYTLLLQDPWTFQEKEYLSIYNGRALTFNLTDLLPATEYTIRLENLKTPGNDKSVSKLLGHVTFTTAAGDGCANSNDVSMMKKNHNNIKQDAQKCLIGNVMSQEKAADCVKSTLGLSDQCSQCFINQGLCTLKKCATHCIFPGSDSCKKCSEAECFSSLLDCSGLPRWAFPN